MPPKTLSVIEQHQLLEALRISDGTVLQHFTAIRNRLAVLLMLDAGLRVGEVTKLKMSDLFFSSKPVENLVLSSSITKTKTERTIPLSSRLKDTAQNLFDLFPDLGDKWGDVYVFQKNGQGRPLSSRQIERIVGTAALEGFGRKINPHMLRHTFATRLMKVTDMRTVQDLLGHKQLSSTQVYTHSNSDDKKMAIDAAVRLDLAENSQKT